MYSATSWQGPSMTSAGARPLAADLKRSSRSRTLFLGIEPQKSPSANKSVLTPAPCSTITSQNPQKYNAETIQQTRKQFRKGLYPPEAHARPSLAPLSRLVARKLPLPRPSYPPNRVILLSSTSSVWRLGGDLWGAPGSWNPPAWRSGSRFETSASCQPKPKQLRATCFCSVSSFLFSSQLFVVFFGGFWFVKALH